MNACFEPTRLLDINTIRYCNFCAQAVVSDTVHKSPNCILDDLNLVDSSNIHTKTLNFGFYQCFLKNCTAQEVEEEGFTEHLTSHGIWLDRAKSKYKYKCGYCTYKTTQQRYLNSHIAICRRNQTENEMPTSSASQQISSERAQESETKGISTGTKWSSKIREHMNLKKTSGHRFRCNECDYSTTQERYLVSHSLNHCPKRANLPDYISRLENSKARAAAPIKLKLKLKRPSMESCNKEMNGGKIGASNEIVKVINLKKSVRIAPISPDTRDSKIAESSTNFGEEHNSIYPAKSSLITPIAPLFSKGKRNVQGINYSTCEYSTTKPHEAICSSNVSTEKLSETMCNVCFYEAHNSWALAVHMQSHSKATDSSNTEETKVHKCMQCNFKTSNTVLINLHTKNCVGRPDDVTIKKRKAEVLLKKVILKKVKTESGSFNCDKCSYSSPGALRLKMHKITEHSKKSESIELLLNKGTSTKSKCPNCPFIHSGKHMSTHLKYCKGNSTEKLMKRCEYCSYLTPYYANMLRHQALKVCQKSTLITSQSTYMDNQKHPKLNCSFCPFKAKLSIMVKHHEARCVSELYKKFRCLSCSDVFETMGKLESHIQKCSVSQESDQEASSVYGLKCQKCPFRTPLHWKLRHHTILCGNELFRCDKCNSIYRYERLYRNHLQTCKNETRLTLNCSECGFLAKTKTLLAMHSSLCGIPKYECRRCQRCNHISSSLESYLRHKKACQKVIDRSNTVVVCDKCKSKVLHSAYCRSHKFRCGRPEYSFKCPHKCCVVGFLAKDEQAIKIHVAKVHGLEKFEKTPFEKLKKAPPKDIKKAPLKKMKKVHSIKKVKNQCIICSYGSPSKIDSSRHNVLCRQKQEGSDKVVTCQEPGCLFLARSYDGRSMKNHIRFNHPNILPRINNEVEMQEIMPRPIYWKCPDCGYQCAAGCGKYTHRALCTKKRNGAGDIITCEYPGCLFLTNSSRGYTRHFNNKHKVIGKRYHGTVKNARRRKNKVLTCKYCQYSMPKHRRDTRKMVTHYKLCSRKRKGDNSIVICSFPGCNFLSENKRGMVKHASIHKNGDKHISAENRNHGRDEGSSSSHTVHNSELTRKQVTSYPLPKVEPVVIEYYTCEKCSFVCYLSDQIKVESHKKNCRTQLFDKLKLPKSTISGEGKDQGQILSSEDTAAKCVRKEESSTTCCSSEAVPDICAEKHSAVSSDNDGRSLENDILDKYDTDDDLDLCLDSEYFI